MVEEDLQYGAWLRGDPYGRIQKEPVKYGGGENQGSRDGVTRVSLEQTCAQSAMPGEDGIHMPVSLTVTRDDAILEAPRQLTVTPPGEGKGQGAGLKSENKISSKLDNSSVTLSIWSEVTEELQWEEVLHHALRKTPFEVKPISTTSFTFSPSVYDILESEEDIPPGFESQHMRETNVSKVIDKIEGYKGNCECVDKIKPVITSSPSKKPNGPSLGAKRANPLVGSSELG
nr:hypothetical protein CFP56_12488 [Quercus suber]